MYIRFEWDDAKNRANTAKHGISFEDASRIFEGFTVSQIDARHDYEEVRELSLGLLDDTALLLVVHTDREGVCRIISARKANRKERQIYEQNIRQTPDTQ